MTITLTREEAQSVLDALQCATPPTFSTKLVEDWQKAVTQLVGGEVKQAGMQEVYQSVADKGTQQQPMTMASTTGTTQEQTEAAFTPQRSDFDIRKYVNDAGDVIYIQFSGDKPQQQIPPGYREEGKPSTQQQQPQTMVATAQPIPTTPQLQMPGVDLAASSPTLPLPTGTMMAKDGGLAVKRTKKPSTSKGLAAKKK